MDRSMVGFSTLLRDAGEAVRNAGKYQLDVVSGVHAGASAKLDAGTVAIGAGKDNSIILFADTVADKHASIDLPTNLIKGICVSPVQEKITLENGGTVEVGQYAELESGETFYCGEAGICISRYADPKTVGKFSIKALAVICLLAIFPLAFGLISNVAVGVADASSGVISALNTGINTQTERLLGVEPTSKKGQLKSFSTSVYHKLEDLKLLHRLRVSTTATGSIRISGSIADSELPRWTNFLQWYDSKATFPPLIRDIQRQNVNKDLPKISSVWMDGEPSVRFSDGLVANIGSEIRGGWKILSIESSSVIVERDGTQVSLTF